MRSHMAPLQTQRDYARNQTATARQGLGTVCPALPYSVQAVLQQNMAYHYSAHVTLMLADPETKHD